MNRRKLITLCMLLSTMCAVAQFDAEAIKDQLIAIAEEVKQPNTYPGPVAIKWSNKCNEFLEAYPDDREAIIAVMDQVASDHKISYEMGSKFVSTASIKVDRKPTPKPAQPQSEPVENTAESEDKPASEVTMPIYPGCEVMDASEEEYRKCSTQLLVQYVYRNQEYPEEARKQGVEGAVRLSYRINEEGYVVDITVAESVHPQLDAEAIRILQSMNEMDQRWTPQTIDGEVAMSYKFSLSVSFKLQ